jgi:hypothetical protein
VKTSKHKQGQSEVESWNSIVKFPSETQSRSLRYANFGLQEKRSRKENIGLSGKKEELNFLTNLIQTDNFQKLLVSAVVIIIQNYDPN